MSDQQIDLEVVADLAKKLEKFRLAKELGYSDEEAVKLAGLDKKAGDEPA